MKRIVYFMRTSIRTAFAYGWWQTPMSLRPDDISLYMWHFVVIFSTSNCCPLFFNLVAHIWKENVLGDYWIVPHTFPWFPWLRWTHFEKKVDIKIHAGCVHPQVCKISENIPFAYFGGDWVISWDCKIKWPSQSPVDVSCEINKSNLFIGISLLLDLKHVI